MPRLSRIKIDSVSEQILTNNPEQMVIDVQEKLQSRLLDAINEAEEKSGKLHVRAFKTIEEILMYNYIPEITNNLKSSISKIIDGSLRHGRGSELALAVKLELLLQMQLGNKYQCSKSFNLYILKALTDKLIDNETRAKLCTVLGLLYFSQYDNLEELLKAMDYFEKMFNNAKKSISSAEDSVISSAALFSWGLLLSKIASKHICGILNKLELIMELLIKLLESPYLNVRVTSGETIALILECVRPENVHFMDDAMPNLIAITKSLSVEKNAPFIVDSYLNSIDITKSLTVDKEHQENQHFMDVSMLNLIDITESSSIAKKKRSHNKEIKSQRATFKDIARFVEHGIEPKLVIAFESESIHINTWYAHHQYMALCDVIGPGITVHLSKNNFIRSILELDH